MIKEGDKESWGVVIARQDDTQVHLLFVLKKAGRFLSSRAAWNRARLGPGAVMVLKVISHQYPT